MESYDLIIVGLGPGGMRAANCALKNNLKVLAFEENVIGGCCLNKGCVPTKAIIHASQIYNEIQNASKFGVIFDEKPKLDFKTVFQNKNTVISKLAHASEVELAKKGLTIIKEHAEIDYENISVNGYKAKNIIVATGSIPYELKNLPFDGENILSSDDILNLEELPKSITIIGTGAIGVEWARIFSNFGVEVSVVEKAENILPLMDVDIQKRMTRIFKQKRIKIYTNTSAVSFENGILKLDNGVEIQSEKTLVAVGRKRCVPDGLICNSDLTTNYKNVYVAGDVVSSKMLAHTASAQCSVIINKILDKEYSLPKNEEIPSVIYGSPEVASIGLNEQDAPYGSKIYNLPVSYLAKSWCDNNIDGFIKIITKDDLIIGAHVVSNEASSLITSIQIMMKKDVKVTDIEEFIFAHPTYSEGIQEAILNG